MMKSNDFEDILFEVDAQSRSAIITINRPERFNAFRGQTVDELVDAFRRTWADESIRSVILTGAGDKAFSTGGEVKQRALNGFEKMAGAGHELFMSTAEAAEGIAAFSERRPPNFGSFA